MYAGLILMQLAIPKLRSAANVKAFNIQLKREGYDVMAWKASERLSAKDTASLDANYGSGWNLAAALLQPRKIQVSARY